MPGTNDLCRCFACDGGLQRWDVDDSPWLEHARWFPHCRYVLDTKGLEYVRNVQAAVAQAAIEEVRLLSQKGVSLQFHLDFLFFQSCCNVRFFIDLYIIY